MTTKPTKTAIVQQIAPTKPLQVIESPEINRHPSPRLGTSPVVNMAALTNILMRHKPG